MWRYRLQWFNILCIWFNMLHAIPRIFLVRYKMSTILEMSRKWLDNFIILKIVTKNVITLLKYFSKGTQIEYKGQCGGIGYKRSTTCVSDLKCYIQNSGFSGCYLSCPQYWQCQSNGKIKIILLK